VESGWYLDMAGSEEAGIFIRCVCEPSLRVYIETEKCYSQLVSVT
jgi:hypothetical protein